MVNIIIANVVFAFIMIFIASIVAAIYRLLGGK